MMPARRHPAPGGWIGVIAGVIAITAACQPGQVLAQVAVTGTLVVAVENASGAPLVGILITTVGTLSGWTREAMTDGRGEARVSHVPIGEYQVTVEGLGYQPRRIERVPVRPGGGHRLTAVLNDVATAPREISTERLAGALVPASRPGAGRWYSWQIVPAVPTESRSLSDLARMATGSGDLVVEGLPARFSTYSLDGLTFRPVGLTYDEAQSLLALGQQEAEALELRTNRLDVELSGAAGAHIAAFSRTGAAQLGGRLTVHGSGAPLSSAAGDQKTPYQEIHGAVESHGELATDRGRFSVGATVRRLEVPLSPAWRAGDDAAALAAFAVAAGVDVEAERRTVRVPDDVLSAFARLDWSLSGRHSLGLSGRFASVARQRLVGRGTGLLTDSNGRDLAASASLTSRMSPRLDNVLRLSATSSLRQRDSTDVASTLLVSSGLALGVTGLRSMREDVASVADALRLVHGGHQLKFGASADVTRHDVQRGRITAREFLFGGAEQLDASRAMLAETSNPAEAAEWSSLSYAVFAQDRWNVAHGLDLQLGARLDFAALPSSEVGRDAEWFRLTGVANDGVTSLAPVLSPRVGVTWNVGGANRWLLHAAAGTHADRVDPRLLAEWQTDDGGGRVTRSAGAVSWPSGSAPGSTTAARLTVLVPEFAAPRTSRVTLGVTRHSGAGTVIHLSGVLRRTEHLPRRVDLNLLPLPVTRDQFGRGIYGTLLKQGSLLAAEPGLNRRFDTYDEVAALTSDGWSDHWGVSAGVERDLAAGLALVAHYTYSRTTDSWFAGRAGGWTVPLPQGLGADSTWAEGRSDFDVPHRASAAIVAALPFGIHVAGVYRIEAGAAFTPAFRAGVDANADGSTANDPAFVDAERAEVSALFGDWPCLRRSAGNFVKRNACRGPATHTLDLTARLSLGRIAGVSPSIMIDAFDVLERSWSMIDSALYLIDPDAPIDIDADARTVDVPLLVNPDFGSELSRRKAGRRLRLGFTLNW